MAVLLLLETSEGHLGAGNVLLWVLKILKQSLFGPDDALVDVGRSVLETFALPGFATKESVQVGSDLMGLLSTDGMALCATRLEEGSTLSRVTRSVRHC